MENNTYYNFLDAVKASEEIIGENGILIDNAGTEWICYNLLEYPDFREQGSNCYWSVGYNGNIVYTEDNGNYNARCIYKVK